MHTTDRAPDTLAASMHGRQGRASRAAMSLAAPVAAVVLLLAACTSTPSPSASAPAPTPSPARASPSVVPSAPPPSVVPTPPEASPTQAAGAPPCEASDIKASHGLVEGGAGSRFTTVVLVASMACSVDLYPAFGLKDGSGNVLINAVAAGPGRIDLDPKLSYQSNVRLANWCANDPAFPLHFDLLVGGAEVKVTGGSFPEEGDLPPCNGEAAGRVFEAQPWEVVP
jgi:hypothetical protein